MNANAYLSLDILAILIFLFLGVKLIYLKTQITSLRLCNCWMVLFLYLLTDLVRIVLVKLGADVNQLIIIITLEFAINGSIGFYWILYIGQLILPNFYNKKISLLVTAILPITYYILLTINHFNGMFFSFSETGAMQFSNINFVLWLISSIDVIIISIICIIKVCGKQYFGNRMVYLVLSSFGLLIIIFKRIEFITQLPIFQMCIIIMVIIIFVEVLQSIISVDPLTGINNKTSLVKYLNRLIKSKTNFYFAMIDIDDFKTVNDQYGHLEGDKAIKLVTNVINELPNFFVSRYGGDEFCLVTTYENMKNTKELINDSLEELCKDERLKYVISVSLGYANYKGQYKTAYDIIKVADLHLYNDKKQSKKLKKAKN